MLFFSSQCCIDSSECPLCKVPLWSKNIRPAYKLKTIVSATANIGRLVMATPHCPGPSPSKYFDPELENKLPEKKKKSRHAKRSQSDDPHEPGVKRWRVLGDVQVEPSNERTEQDAAVGGVALSAPTLTSNAGRAHRPDSNFRRVMRGQRTELESRGARTASSSSGSAVADGGRRKNTRVVNSLSSTKSRPNTGNYF